VVSARWAKTAVLHADCFYLPRRRNNIHASIISAITDLYFFEHDDRRAPPGATLLPFSVSVLPAFTCLLYQKYGDTAAVAARHAASARIAAHGGLLYALHPGSGGGRLYRRLQLGAQHTWNDCLLLLTTCHSLLRHSSLSFSDSCWKNVAGRIDVKRVVKNSPW